MQQAEKQGKRNIVGAYGEEVCVSYLDNLGFSIIARNYLKKWGEIDVIAQKNGVIHFVEVKTVSHGTKCSRNEGVSHGTWRPEEQVTTQKWGRMTRTIESWLLEHSYEDEWQVDVAAIRLWPQETKAEVTYMPNLIQD